MSVLDARSVRFFGVVFVDALVAENVRAGDSISFAEVEVGVNFGNFIMANRMVALDSHAVDQINTHTQKRENQKHQHSIHRQTAPHHEMRVGFGDVLGVSAFFG